MSGALAMVVAIQAQSQPASVLDLRRVLDSPATLVRVALLLLVGLPVAWMATSWVRRYITHLYNPQKGLVASKLIFYPLAVLILVSVLRELGFNLTPLLGAAGIFGIALGFASQTSVSNIISGFFLLAEEPFKIGEVITVDDVTGAVLTIDMLSVKIRTFDNKMVRIPNETLVKTRVTNVSRFPIRRVDLAVGVAYKEDIGRVRRILFEVAEVNPLVLMEPEPVVIFQGYADSSIQFLFAVWAKKESWLAVKNALSEEVKVRFDSEGVEMPFPHVSLYTGSRTDPFPVRILPEAAE